MNSSSVDLYSSSVKDSGTLAVTSQPDFANKDLREFSFTELALLAIVFILFFKFFIFDIFNKSMRG